MRLSVQGVVHEYCSLVDERDDFRKVIKTIDEAISSKKN